MYDSQMTVIAGKIDTDILAELNRMEDFVNNIEKTCLVQKKEVEGLKERNMAHFSELEYVKSLNERSKDPIYIQTLRSQPLDSMLSKRFRSIERTVG